MSRRILLADDSVTIQKVIELTFMDDDYEVRAVGNGDEAIAMLTALTVDFVIADVHMPGASGYEVCRRSKQLRPEVPVLLLVGTFEPFDEAQARESGANSYLKKPFDSQELLGRVHELLGPAPAAAGGPHPEAAAAAPAAPATAAAPGTPATSEASATPATASAASAPVAAEAGTAAAASAPTAPAGAVEAAEPAAAHAPDTAGAGAGEGIRLTGGIEAAATWQEFELEAEPELIPDPWSDVPLPPPAAAKVPPAVQPHEHAFEQPFALGDLEEEAVAAGPAIPAAPAEHDRPSPAGAQAPAAPASPASAASPAAAERFDRPFTLGEPLDDRVLLDQAESQEGDLAKAAPAASAAAGLPELRATQAEPLSRLGGVLPSFRPAPKPPATPATPELPAVPETPAILEPAAAALAPDTRPGGSEKAGETGQAEQAEERVAAAAGNGQPAAPMAPDAAAALGDRDVERIARRVVELIGDKVVRDIAWEVIPDLAEVVIKDRLRELESQIE
jgi:CheY-like chemotaxis protein